MAQRCVRYKRVRVRGQGIARRCAKYSGRSSNGRRHRGYRRRASGFARRGSHCMRYKRVPSAFGGTVRRCARFAGGRRSGRRKGGYRKGHRPFNKGRVCIAKKRVYSSRLRKYVTRCASFGGGGSRGSRPGTAITLWRPGGSRMSQRPTMRPSGPTSLFGGGGPPGMRYAGR